MNQFSMPADKLRKIIKEYISLDDDIRILSKVRREKADRRKILSTILISSLKEGGSIDLVDNGVSLGQLTVEVREKRASVNAGFLRQTLGKYYKNEEQANKIIDYLLQNRTGEKVFRLSRKLNKVEKDKFKRKVDVTISDDLKKPGADGGGGSISISKKEDPVEKKFEKLYQYSVDKDGIPDEKIDKQILPKKDELESKLNLEVSEIEVENKKDVQLNMEPDKLTESQPTVISNVANNLDDLDDLDDLEDDEEFDVDNIPEEEVGAGFIPEPIAKDQFF